MKDLWPKLPLSEALQQRECDVKVDAAASYQFAGVYCFGRGVFRGQQKLGNQFAYQRLTRIRAGEFVYPKLMAWEGAFGIVPDTCDGCVVSPEFPVFKLNRDRITPEFLGFYFRVPRVWEEISGGSTGTNVRRRRLHPDDFLRAEIPMPSLAEQSRVAAKIKELVTQIHEAQSLRHGAEEEGQALSKAAITDALQSVPQKHWVPLGEVCRLVNGKAFKPHEWGTEGLPIVRIQNLNDESAPFNYCGFPVDDRFLIGDNELLLSWSGTPGTSFGAHIWRRGTAILNQHIFKVLVDDQTISKEFLRYGVNFKLDEMISQAHGGVGLQHITKGKLERISIPVPTVAEQRRIVAELDSFQTQVAALKRLQTETAAELDALLPAILDRAFKGEL